MKPKPETFYSNGKLLLTGEYVVLDGALSLALPTKLGQSLIVTEIDVPKIIWESYDEKGTIWFEDTFLLKDIKSERQNHPNEISRRIIQILEAVKQLNPEFLSTGNGYKITTKLEFPKNWGLGTSSTLINNIAEWTNVDAFELLANTFGGSGYDIACAQNNSAITFQKSEQKNLIQPVQFSPLFKNSLYFVYLNKKQNSREGIAHYNSNKSDISVEISSVNEITQKMIVCSNLHEFQELMEVHEQIISGIIRQKPIKPLLFSDFIGSIKSLGAWGGDFVMVASEPNPTEYFRSKGFETIFSYEDLIK